jgi:imidazolonepropionase-like amidohydrolase
MSRKSQLRTVVRFLAAVVIACAPIGLSSQQNQFGSAGQMRPDEYIARFGLPRPPAGGYAIRAGRMFDPRTGRNLPNQVILIKNDIITDVGPADRVQIPADAQVINLSNATVLPGLIDHHLHLMDSISSRMPNVQTYVLRAIPTMMHHLQGGYTTVVDMGTGDSWASIDLRNAVNRGWLPGPRQQVAGPPINPRSNNTYASPSVFTPFGQGPFQPSGQPSIQNNTMLGGAEQARMAVRERSWYGVDWIKMYLTEDTMGGGAQGGGFGGAFFPDGRMINIPSLTKEEAAAVVDEAHRRGIKVATHVYGGEALRIALEVGVDLPMHHILGFNGEEGLSDEVISMWLKPLPNGKRRPAMHTLWDLEDADPKTSASGVGLGGGGMHSGDMRRTGGKASRMSLSEASFRRLHKAGVMQVFGSGEHQNALSRPPGEQSMQFPVYVKWGMTPVEALRTATINAAETLNYDLGSKVGTIEKGKFADVMAVAGDPLVDINEMLKPAFVMKGGVVFRDDITTAPRPTTSSASAR